MIECINNIHTGNSINNRVVENKISSITKADKVSFSGNISRVIISSRPESANILAYIGVNNASKNAKGLFSKFMCSLFKKLSLVAQPVGVFNDSNTKAFLSLKEGNVVTGGLLARKNPQTKNLRCFMINIDRTKQSKKAGIKTFYNLAKAVCEHSEKEKLSTTTWCVEAKDREISDLFKKFAVAKKRDGSAVTEFSTSTERLREFLDKIKDKHQKILG